MNTFLDYLTVLAVAALLLAPSLYGAFHDRRIDRQLAAAAGGGRDEKSREAPSGASRLLVPNYGGSD
ncbi:hypothetical protein GCM10010302_53800 [Streptomyces polychromogenes]|uniref:Uncharacterized protein n=1 Tax=Streptomyces polychromogenes TaxID=67342 RepID=A0ABN0VK79_9ACTN